MTIRTFQSSIQMLDKNPPDFSPNAIREKAFLSLGKFLEKNAREKQTYDLKKKNCPLWPIIRDRLIATLDDLDQTSLTHNQVMAWQWYNCGVIIKSDDVVIGMDIIAMPRFFGWKEPPDLTERIAGQLDLLLISHQHKDHYDRKLIKACLRFGKPVFMPKPMALEWGFHPNLHGIEDGFTTDIDDLKIVARQGYHLWRQDINEVPLIYYEVTCQEGYTFIFGGDIDLFFLPWRNPNAAYEDGQPEQKGSTLDAAKIAIDRIQPEKILYEHYAELDHIYGGFPHSYDIALNLKKHLPIPSELMFWGERIALTP